MTTPNDEFRFLPGDAAFWGLAGPVPSVARLDRTATDGALISAIRYGDAPPEVALLHGAGLNAHTFDSTVLALRRPALSVDLPGHGHSDWRADAVYTPAALAPDVAEAVAAWAPPGQILVGQSLGALTAARVASLAPGLARALVLVDITPGLRPREDASAVVGFLSGPRDFADVDEVVDRAIEYGIGSDRRLLAHGVELNTRERADGRIEFRHHLAHLDQPVALTRADAEPLWGDLEAFDGPVLLVAATHGIVPPELVAEFRERLPDARVVSVEAGHNVQEHAPLALAEAIASVDG